MLRFKLLVDLIPNAGGLGVDFAFPVGDTAAGAVEHGFWAAGDRAEAAELVEEAVAAEAAAFLEDTMADDFADEEGVRPAYDLYVGVEFVDGLDAAAAGHDQKRFGLGQLLADVAEESL